MWIRTECRTDQRFFSCLSFCSLERNVFCSAEMPSVHWACYKPLLPCASPITPIRAQMSLLGCRDGGTPLWQAGDVFLFFYSPFNSKCKCSKSSQSKAEMVSDDFNGGNANKRCDFLHLSCRLSFTDQCAGGSQCPRSDQSSWLKTKTGPRCCRALAQSIARGCLVHLSRDAHG